MVPRSSTTAPTALVPSARVRASGCTTSSPGPDTSSRAPRTSAVDSATRTMESRKCDMTVHGLSPVRTVMPPSTACAGMPARTPTATRWRRRRCGQWVRTTQSETSARTPTTTGQRPVPELDEVVVRALRRAHRREGAGLALGPGAAPEAAAGEAHDAPGDHDADLADEVGQQERTDPARRDGGKVTRGPGETARAGRAVDVGHGRRGGHPARVCRRARCSRIALGRLGTGRATPWTAVRPGRARRPGTPAWPATTTVTTAATAASTTSVAEEHLERVPARATPPPAGRTNQSGDEGERP